MGHACYLSFFNKAKNFIMRHIVLGDEAIAQGAIDAGISGVYAYPGTPSTEITEYIIKKNKAEKLNLHASWSANEKTALEAALGMSYAGKRVLVAMKHVGLNVAMDAFMNMAISGINGGLVIVVADDPSMHSSQNEQDSRYLAHFAKVPIVEPANQQEAYDAIRHAFNLSERLEIPVLFRIVTRLAHSRSLVNFNSPDCKVDFQIINNTDRFKLIPTKARPQYEQLIKKQSIICEESKESPFNHLAVGHDTSLGIVACGIAYNYLMEHFQNNCPYNVLKLSQYPIPKEQITTIYEKCDKVLVLEDGYPFIEEQLKNYFDSDSKIIGRLTNHLNRTGELNPDLVAKALGISKFTNTELPAVVKPRLPKLCEGCGHIDLFNSLNEIKQEIGDGKIFGDIGCYALGALPPFETINTLIDMGASVTMAKGAADAGLKPAIAIIGDSTFTHSGMTGLLDCVNDHSPVTIIISDNAAVAMTGGQESAAWMKLKNICMGLGVHPEHVKIIEPLPKNHSINVSVIKQELDYPDVSVIISQRACVRLPAERKKIAKEMAYV
jgi:indolepyruvate ferredoxin oxidoreductase alpha subunit